VALVGDGGDEVFAGYPRYRGGILARYLQRMPSFLRAGIIAPLASLIPESSAGHHGWRRSREFLAAASLNAPSAYASWVEYFGPEERRRLLGLNDAPDRPIARLYAEAASTDPLNAMQETDLCSFLPGNILAYADAMSMRHALELRAPMLDHRLAEAVARIASSTRFAHGPKTILKAIARRLLPAAMIDRPKRGFNPPMGIWIARELSGVIAEKLTSARLTRLGLDGTLVARLLSEHGRGRDHGLKIWALLVLDAWAERTGVRNLSAAAAMS
jgi:asparagine synthase (glutamine-hydrolysing)